MKNIDGAPAGRGVFRPDVTDEPTASEFPSFLLPSSF
jgi:hypothetical protein